MKRAGAALLVAAFLPSLPSPVIEAAEPALSIRTFPSAVTLGGSGALEVQVENAGGKPKLHTLAGGSLTDPTPEDGEWISRYHAPPGQTAPGYDVIVAEWKGTQALAVVQWIAQAKLPVTVSQANASVTVTVGGRTFGPVQAGVNQTVPVEVEIPPGAQEVTVTAIGSGKDALHSSEQLALPPLNRVFIGAPATAKIKATLEAQVVVIGKDGAAVRTAPQVSASGGTVLNVLEGAPGLWRARIEAGGGLLTITAHAEGARGRAMVKVPPLPPPTQTPPPGPSPTPFPLSSTDLAAVPPPPDCSALHAAPGEITTARELRSRIERAASEADLLARRSALIGLGCQFPDEHDIQLRLAATNLLLGDNLRAVDVISPLLADENEIHDEHLALGYSYRASAELRLGELDAAVNDARAAETHMPGLYSATYTLGEAEFLKEDFSEAAAALLSAYRTAPQFATGADHQMLADLLERRGDAVEAVTHRLAAARFDSNSPAAWEAAASAAEAAKVWPRAYEAWLALSVLHGDDPAAEAGLVRARAADPNNEEVAFVDAALSALAAKNATKATFLLEKVLAGNPANFAARYELARASVAAGAAGRAARDAGSTLNAAPHFAPALILAGDAERLRGESAKAQARYREALANHPPAAVVAEANGRLADLERQ